MSELTPDQLSALGRLKALFATLPDARQPGKVLYPLDEVLLIAFCALLSDCGDFTEMEVFAETQESWLRNFLPLPHGTPSHDVFRNVFMALKPEGLVKILGAWGAELGGKHIAIDGKTLRGTGGGTSGHPMVHVVRAWVDAHSLSAGQVTCAEKSNEIEAIPRLLETLQLKGAVITIDAAGTRTAIAEKIHEAGADYVLSLKANQKNTLAAVEGFFESAPATALQNKVTLEKSHGRCERREYSISADLSWFHKSWKWPGLRSVARVRRTVERGQKGAPLHETHYFLCSLPADAARLATLVRDHWSVENRCHWMLDVVFGEDHCQIRDANAAQNLSLLRELTLKTLREEPTKASLRSKRKRAALNPNFRLALLLSLQA
jgi:predicted transposase YbfD/YdcC